MKKLLLILMGLGLFLLSACEINVNVDGIKNYTIRFLNYDYSLLQELKVREGDTPTYSKDTPVREDDENYTYTFSGWDKEIKPATSDEVYKAQFTQTKKGSPIEVEKVLASFMNGDIKLAEVEVEKGETPVYNGSAPTKASDEEFDYTFEGWAPELSPITEDTTYQAQFIAHEKETDEFDVETPWIEG